MNVTSEITETVKRRLAFQKTFSQEHGGWRKKSLIADAKFETAANKEFKKQERRLSKTDSFGDEEGFAPGLLSDDFPEEFSAFNLVVTFMEGTVSLAKIIRLFESNLLPSVFVERSTTGDKTPVSAAEFLRLAEKPQVLQIYGVRGTEPKGYDVHGTEPKS